MEYEWVPGLALGSLVPHYRCN